MAPPTEKIGLELSVKEDKTANATLHQKASANSKPVEKIAKNNNSTEVKKDSVKIQ